MTLSPPAWPWPAFIAHRGGGRLAPENTLAAIRTGADAGFRMVEFDVKLSADGLPFLLHDDTVDRTSNGHGTAHELDWRALGEMDFGSWHGPEFAGEPAPSLYAVAPPWRSGPSTTPPAPVRCSAGDARRYSDRKSVV